MAKPHNLRKRQPSKTKNDNIDDEAESPTKNVKPNNKPKQNKQSLHGMLFVLLLMVGITWGIAASSYLGIINYRALFARTTSISTNDITTSVSLLCPVHYEGFFHPLRYFASFLIATDDFVSNIFTVKDKVSFIDKRRVSVLNSPVEKISFSWENNVASKTEIPKSNVKEDIIGDVGINSIKNNDDNKNVNEKDDTKPVKKSKKNTAKDNADKNSVLNLLTSPNDKPIIKLLSEGFRNLKSKQIKEAKKIFEKLVKSNPSSPGARFGNAEVLNKLADQEQSNKLLEQAISAYNEVIDMPECPSGLKKKAFIQLSTRLVFLGKLRKALQTTLRFVQEFPNDADSFNKHGVSLLMTGQNEKAKGIFQKAVEIDPSNGFSLVHLGFILKTSGDWVNGVKYLRQGILTNEEGTQVGKFYFHLGDALFRINQTEESEKIYKLGAEKGLFKSKYQRSLYNVDRLKSRPFWTAKQADAVEYVKVLEKNWKVIRDEALKLMDVKKGFFQLEEEGLKDSGEWRQFTLYQRGQQDKACKKVPKTCALLSKMPNAIGCKRGQIKYSIMMPGTHIWPHTGPTNCRLRMHLGLVIPTTGDGARIRCADEIKTWQEGKVLIFDDSFEHEVWQNAESFRLIIIVDIWHPDLTDRERQTLSPI